MHCADSQPYFMAHEGAKGEIAKAAIALPARLAVAFYFALFGEAHACYAENRAHHGGPVYGEETPRRGEELKAAAPRRTLRCSGGASTRAFKIEGNGAYARSLPRARRKNGRRVLRYAEAIRYSLYA